MALSITSGTTGQTAGGGVSTINAPAVAGEFQLQIDLSLMANASGAAGDVVEIRVNKIVKASGADVTVWYAQFCGLQPTDAKMVPTEWIANTLTDTGAIQFTINQPFGTTRAFPYSVINRLDFTAAALADVTRWNSQNVPTPNVNGVPIIDFKYILGTAVTEGAGGRDAAAFTKFFDKATPTGTINSIPDAVAGAAGGLFIAGTNAATAVTTSFTTTFTGNLTGSVDSVTGAVGSVAGNVGGNVTGSVGSVVGAVGSVTGNVGGNVVGSVASVTAPVSITAGQIFIKKNTALAAFTFMMTDSTNHAPAAGLTVTATRSIDGGAFSACANSVTEISSGFYKITLASTDLNGTVIALRFSATGADDRDLTIITQA